MKNFSRIFAVLLAVSLLFTQLLVPVSAEVLNCTCGGTDKDTKQETVAPTCGDYGYDMYKCKSCNGLYATNYKAPTGEHDYIANPGQEATCTEFGWAAYNTCANCDYTDYAKIDALGHDLVTVVAKDATCTEAGYAEYKDCSRCDYTEGYAEVPALDHNIKVTVENPVEAGCETPATETHKEYCTVCNTTIKETVVETAPAHGHNYVLIDSKPQICATADGMNVYACEYCRDRKTEVIVKNEKHDYEVTSTSATCTNAGIEVHTCKTCGFVTEMPVAAKGHTPVTLKAVPATCTETGLTAGKQCSTCGEILTPQKVVAAKGHTYAKDDKGTVIAPTCVAEGYTYKTCTVCKKDIVVDGSVTAIDPLAHKSVISSVKVNPTCTEVGYTAEISCELCKDVLENRKEIPALGHNYVAVRTNMTCEGGEFDTYTCSRCKDSYVVMITEPTGHNPDPSVGVVAPTCEAKGYDYQICMNDWCRQELKSNYVDALGHDMTAWVNAGDVHTRECTRCDLVEEKAHDTVAHDAKAPACGAIGWDAYETCETCDYTTYVELPGLRHQIEYVDAQEVTCDEIGWDSYCYCVNCDFTTYEEIAALGCDIHQFPAKANCLEDGWGAYEACSRCDYTTQKIIPAIGSHDIVDVAAKQPTYDEEGCTAGQYCARCGEDIVESIVIDRIKEEVTFTYEATGLNGSEYTVNSGKVVLNVYMNVNSTLARLWGADLVMNFDSNLTLLTVEGSAFEYANNSAVDGNNIKLAQGMEVGSNYKTFEEGKYLFATLTFRVNEEFYADDVAFEIVADECELVRRDIENNVDFANELVVDFGTGAEIYVARLGDANADNDFTATDAMSLAQWFATADVEDYEAVYDMNKDGFIDGVDFALLRGAVVRDHSYLEF